MLSVVDQSLVDFVVQHPGCMAIDIARYLRLNRSTISRQLSGLLAAGVPTWRAVGEAFTGRHVTARMHYDAAPFGVGYLVADWVVS